MGYSLKKGMGELEEIGALCIQKIFYLENHSSSPSFTFPLFSHLPLLIFQLSQDSECTWFPEREITLRSEVISESHITEKSYVSFGFCLGCKNVLVCTSPGNQSCFWGLVCLPKARKNYLTTRIQRNEEGSWQEGRGSWGTDIFLF